MFACQSIKSLEAVLFSSVFTKNCFNNMQQVYRITPIPKCFFNKVAKRLYWNHTSPWVFFYKFAPYFQNTFSKEHLWRAAFESCTNCFVNPISFWLRSLYAPKNMHLHFSSCFSIVGFNDFILHYTKNEVFH